MREAFMRSLTDPELLFDAKKRRINRSSRLPGEELERLAKEVMAGRRSAVNRCKLKKLLGK